MMKTFIAGLMIAGASVAATAQEVPAPAPGTTQTTPVPPSTALPDMTPTTDPLTTTDPATAPTGDVTTTTTVEETAAPANDVTVEKKTKKRKPR